MKVQGWSEAPRGAPLFETIYVFQNYPLDAGIRERADSSLRISETKDLSRSNYDLIIRAIPGKELHLNAIYNGRRFEPGSMERLLNHLQCVLEGMAENEKGRVMGLSLMSEQERRQIVLEWNETTAAYPRDLCVRQLFEQQVELTPDTIAVVYEGQQLTYQELNRRANQLACYLREKGVSAEVKVGLCVERSLELIVGLLGVMKAGGAYLPLDADYPQERLAYMIEDAECRIILCKHNHVEKLIEARIEVLRLDADWGAIA